MQCSSAGAPGWQGRASEQRLLCLLDLSARGSAVSCTAQWATYRAAAPSASPLPASLPASAGSAGGPRCGCCAVRCSSAGSTVDCAASLSAQRRTVAASKSSRRQGDQESCMSVLSICGSSPPCRGGRAAQATVGCSRGSSGSRVHHTEAAAFTEHLSPSSSRARDPSTAGIDAPGDGCLDQVDGGARANRSCKLPRGR